MSENTVEIDREALATIADEAAESLPFHEGEYADELEESVQEAYDALGHEW